jgi:hypothetical protein
VKAHLGEWLREHVERKHPGHLLVGVVGWLASKVVRGTTFGLIGDLVEGVADAFVAAF